MHRLPAKIGDRALQCTEIVPEQAEGAITVVAQQPPDFAGFMVVVNGHEAGASTMHRRFWLVANRAKSILSGKEVVIGFDSNAVFITKARTLGVVAFLLAVFLRPCLVVAGGAFFAHALITVTTFCVLVKLCETFELLALATKPHAFRLIPRAGAVAVVVPAHVLKRLAGNPTNVMAIAVRNRCLSTTPTLAIANRNRGISIHVFTCTRVNN